MSQKSVLKITLNVALMAVLIACGICCTVDEWECESGQCIKSDSLCDGAIDCLDRSDEIADSCIQQTCPTFSFQCAYGACVHGGAKCNNIKDCADNSDETYALCKGGESKGTNSNCSEDEFKCTSGECISQDSVCDGHSDCKDKSDESVETCASNECPSFAFRCGYGACIRSDKKCDGHDDCRDKSDEASLLCGYPRPPMDPVPPTRPVPPTQDSCKAPSIPNSRLVYENNPSRVIAPGQIVENSASITYGCQPGYSLKGSIVFNHCQNSQWLISPDPECIKDPGTRPATSGCTVPIIPNSRLLFEVDLNKVLGPRSIVPDGASIEYQCEASYKRVGQAFNYCRNSQWISPHPQCIKFCEPKHLKGITFKADCKKDLVSVSCDESIEPGTIAEISCKIQYRQPESATNFLKCGDDGLWDFLPQRCLPECGKNAPKIQGFIANGNPTNITQVPWHVGIYSSFSGQYDHICGGTIISAGVVISAAHCFWDKANKKIYGHTFYAIGAGKYYRDYYKFEQYAQYQNVSAIHTHAEFQDEDKSYRYDIAVLLLTNYLILSPFVAPACIFWEEDAGRVIASNINGKIAGWGLTEYGNFSTTLHTAVSVTSSFYDCDKEFSDRYPSTITNDKFCVINRFATTACRGDSGGGFVVEKLPHETAVRTRHYLWGIVSGGVPSNHKCSETEFVTFTNIQFYKMFVTNIANTRRPY